ncbi:MAG: hypothetical protein HYT37_02400 [Candidatus Sungbacteria bacterium]|nr:hypothetical protein [Candidatus Sungbacteria bacterium]
MSEQVVTIPSENIPVNGETDHGKLYWAFRHTKEKITDLLRRHKILLLLMAGVVLITSLILRAAIHPYVMVLRTRIFLVVLGAPLFYMLWQMLFHGSWKRRILTTMITIPLLYGALRWGEAIHEYLALYWRYVTITPEKFEQVSLVMASIASVSAASVILHYLKKSSWKRRLATCGITIPLLAGAIYWRAEIIDFWWKSHLTYIQVELEELLLTGHERIQPLHSIYSLANEKMDQNESPSIPDTVRIGKEYRWTMAVEPTYAHRALSGVHELFNVSVTTPSPDFSKEGSRVEVDFPTGEGLLFGRNSFTATIKTLSLWWRYWNYEPTDVAYVTDENGEWVQLVSLVRWKGIFFPRPEFGGVQVIRQISTQYEKENKIPNFLEFISQDISLMLFGVGEWIPPEEIGKHTFLVGQNVLPQMVSRYIGNSFRFQNGFFAPFPLSHKGDIRIPDLLDDINPQPFATFFYLPDREGALCHYLSLEPYDPDKQGTNTSLFIPTDGSGPIYVYKHFRKGRDLLGVSTIATKVMDSKKLYNWEKHRPVEHRPFIKLIDGKPRFFWLTTIVTKKDDETIEAETSGTEKIPNLNRKFIAGANPEIALTDGVTGEPIWVDPAALQTWVEELEKHFQH